MVYNLYNSTNKHSLSKSFFVLPITIQMKTSPSITVAVADDHPSLRAGVSTIISSSPDFSVVFQAANGKELLERLSECDILPDVILLDISMPVMNGYEVMDIIHKRWPEQKVLAYSMYDDEFPVITMLLRGAKGFVSKTSTPDELRKALRLIHENGYYYQGNISEYISNAGSNGYKKIPHLSNRELEFLAHCCKEVGYNDIADLMGVSSRTIENYYKSLFKKLHLKSRVGLVAFAIHMGLVVNSQALQGQVKTI